MCSPGFTVLMSRFLACLHLASSDVLRTSLSRSPFIRRRGGALKARAGAGVGRSGPVAQITKAKVVHGGEAACTGRSGPTPRELRLAGTGRTTVPERS